MVGSENDMTGPSTVHTAPAHHSGLAYGALALLGVVWGFTFVLIRASVETIDPTVVVLILDVSAVVSLGSLFAILHRNPVPAGTRARLPAYFLLGLTNTIPFLAFAWGVQYISSGLAAILSATTPLWTAIFAYWVTPDERPSRLIYGGVIVGFAGVGILVAPQLLSGPLRLDAVASLVVLIGAGSLAAGALVQRRLLAGVHGLDTGLWQWLCCTVIIIPIAAPGLPDLNPSALSLAAAVMLGAVGSGLASVLFYFILNNLGATRGSSVIFLIPLTAVFWGALLFQERLTVIFGIGMAVILIGMLLTMYTGGWRRSR